MLRNIAEQVSWRLVDLCSMRATPHCYCSTSCIDVIRGDSGNYTCQVEGPQNTILGQTTHYVYVRG